MSDESQPLDSFLTCAAPASGMFKIKGSKHYGFVFPIRSESDVEPHLKEIRKKYHDARHHAFAYRLGIDGEVWRTSDDGEPSNSAGPPILGAFKSRDITNCLGIVVRYFGGTKLGVGGLIEAYRTAILYALDDAQITEEILENMLELSFTYDLIGTAMNHIDKWNATPVEQTFLESCRIVVKIRRGHVAAFKTATQEIYGIGIKILP